MHRQTTPETTLNSAIKKSAKADRRDWLDGMVHTGDWSGIQFLRRGRLRRQGRLRNQEGNLVASDMRAQTMVDYLAKVQWAPYALDRDVPEGLPLGPALPIVTDPFQVMEVRHALQVLKVGKAAGVDDVLPD